MFFEKDVEIPAEAQVLGTLDHTAEAKEAERIGFMDLRKHSEYESAYQYAGPCSMLPGGVESFAVHPAYKKIFEQATYLNARYGAFKRGQELQPPLRNMLVTGMPDIRKLAVSLALFFGSWSSRQELLQRLHPHAATRC